MADDSASKSNPLPDQPHDPDPRRVAVLGPGGVGGLLAGLLARAGADVVCLASDETAAALRERGLQVTSGRYGTFGVPVRAAAELSEPVDVCLVTVKATSLLPALERVPAAALGDALLIPLLNGVEHVHMLREHYPDAAVVPATIRVESNRTAAGRIRHGSPFAAIELATTSATKERVRRFAAQLERAGLDVRVRADEVSMLWDKLGFIGPIALLTTHAGEPAGVVREARRDDLVAVVGEVAAVARAEGAAGDPAAVLSALDAVPAEMRSSMQRDAAAGPRAGARSHRRGGSAGR